jgi:hypothetical protein
MPSLKMAAEIARSRNAIQMWAAVRVDVVRQTYDIYWGLVDDLPNKKGIPMSPSDRRRHRTLALNVFDSRIEPRWSNVKVTPRSAIWIKDGRPNLPPSRPAPPRRPVAACARLPA